MEVCLTLHRWGKVQVLSLFSAPSDRAMLVVDSNEDADSKDCKSWESGRKASAEDCDLSGQTCLDEKGEHRGPNAEANIDVSYTDSVSEVDDSSSPRCV
jgi:hypothetical protein